MDSISEARWRLGVLELAEKLGSVAEACRRRGVGRSTFYDWRRRYQAGGIDGLINLPPKHKFHPHTTPAEILQRVLDLALEKPAAGCNRLEAILAKQGIRRSAVTLQKLLNAHNLGSRHRRWLAVEELFLHEPEKLTNEQIAFLESQNPCFRERNVESSAPGEMLCADAFPIRSAGLGGGVHLFVVVDSYGGYAFCAVGAPGEGEKWTSLFRKTVVPFYGRRGRSIKVVLIGNHTESERVQPSDLQIYLTEGHIAHSWAGNRRVRMHGFVERFRRTILAEFSPSHAGNKPGLDITGIQRQIDVWLLHYNYERPLPGYRNYGLRPIETVDGIIREGLHDEVS